MDNHNKCTLEEINTPVNVDDFVKVFSSKFQKWGNSITDKLEETWKQNCLVFNNVIANKENVIKYIVSAPTGSAKTENTITYCAMIPKGIRVLISTSQIIEVDRLSDDINNEANDNRACSFHSKSEISVADASKYQVVVVTHAFYKDHYQGTTNWNKIAENRDLIIIDEALDTMKESSINVNDLHIAANLFEILFKRTSYAHSKSFHSELSKLVNDLDALCQPSPSNGKGTSLVNSNKMWTVFNDNKEKVKVFSIRFPKYKLFPHILEENKSIKFNKILTGIDDQSNDIHIRNKMIETFVNLNDFKDRQVYITSNNGEYSLNRVIDSTPDKSLVCFDATADINKIYAIRSQYHKDLVLVPRIKGVRDYSSVIIHKASVNTSKKSIDDTFASSILKSANLGSKTLIVTHKANRVYFEKLASITYPSKIIEVAHWNALTGLNNWQDFDTCIIAGLNHKPKSFSQNRTLINTDEDTAFGILQNSLNNDIEITDLTSEIIQAINRIRIRTVIDSKGGCKPANIYITLPIRSNVIYTQLIKEHMTGIQIVDWNLTSNKTTKSDHFSTIIAYLLKNMNIGDKVSVKDLKQELDITSESFRSVIGKTEDKKKDFSEKISKFGLEIIEIPEVDAKGRKRKTPTKYICRVK